MPQIYNKNFVLNACGEMLKILFKAESSVKAHSGQPQLYKHARELRAQACEMLTIYLNSEFIRVASPGCDIPAIDMKQVYDVLPLVKQWWEKNIIPTGRNPYPNVETLLWLCSYVHLDGFPFPPFTPEAEAKIVKSFTPQ